LNHDDVAETSTRQNPIPKKSHPIYMLISRNLQTENISQKLPSLNCKFLRTSSTSIPRKADEDLHSITKLSP
jgi:hypothetical protein